LCPAWGSRTGRGFYPSLHACGEAIEHDKNTIKRPIIAIVDVKSQAYGRPRRNCRYLSCRCRCCRRLRVGKTRGSSRNCISGCHALSGAFLTHGYQANEFWRSTDGGVMIHAMHKEAAARVTRRSVGELEKLAKEIAPMSYDMRDTRRLGLLYKLLDVEKIRSSLHCRKIRKVQANWSQPSRMPARSRLSSQSTRIHGCARNATGFPSGSHQARRTVAGKVGYRSMIQDLANSLVPIFVGLLFGMRQAYSR